MSEVPNRVISNYKDKVVFINEDFCQVTIDHCKELWKEVKLLREKGKVAYFQYRSIVVNRKDNTG